MNYCKNTALLASKNIVGLLGYIVMLRAQMFRSLIPVLKIKE